MRSPRATSRRRGGSAASSILTCTGVSFAHGSNDGQKGGMGLIMLILIGTVPTAYALNRAPAPAHVEPFQRSVGGRGRRDREAGGRLQHARRPAPLGHGLSSRSARSTEGTYVSLASLVKEIAAQVGRVRFDRQDPGQCRQQYAKRHVSRV